MTHDRIFVNTFLVDFLQTSTQLIKKARKQSGSSSETKGGVTAIRIFVQRFKVVYEFCPERI